MQETNYTVYKHTAPNGKVYIGITSQKPESRWGNGNGYSSSTRFRNAIRKYGWDNITHEIIRDGLTLEEANIAERKLIKRYDSRNKDKGYNMEPGGNAKGRLSEDTKRKIAESKLGERNPQFGKPTSDYQKQRAREANSHPKSKETIMKMCAAQQNRSEETRRKLHDSSKKTEVICIESGVVYDSVTSAAKAVNAPPANITACCKGRRNLVGGFHWRYFSA